ncbi:MAG TPA: hypothetical protein VJU15_12800 [Gemmatimonadales bacterium]|nr:hypothetical protein [Gemmatimonadales bacterium]
MGSTISGTSTQQNGTIVQGQTTTCVFSNSYRGVTVRHLRLTGGSIAGSGFYECTFTHTVSGPVGTEHKDQVKAVGKDDETNSDTKPSSIVTVAITQ